MRTCLVTALGLTLVTPAAANAASFLYTFDGVVTYANNVDATFIYASQDDPITFSLRVQDNLPTATYTYGPSGSTAVGGPDYAPGTLLPVDRKVTVHSSSGGGGDFTPLETGFHASDKHSAFVSKNLATHNLSLTMNFETYEPPYAGCQERCSGTRITHTALADVFSDGFSSPDYRELGTFDLKAGSVGTLGDSFSTFIAFGDFYELNLTRLTVTQLPDAVPETATWVMILGGLGLAGTALRRRQGEPARVVSA